jgi:16S rRNA (cytosine1402-N4)-methyltransferase
MGSDLYHVPAMLAEVLAYLSPRLGGVYVDCTIGGGGHSKKILEVLGPDGILIGLDQDPHALEESSRVFHCSANVKLVHANFSDLEKVLRVHGIKEVNGCLFDLGVSSRQLESISRGFSFRADAQLDMRMKVQSECTAYDLVNRLSVKELGRIFWEYGDERWANRLARRICEQRQKKPIRTTLELARIAEECIPGVKRKKTLHPATKMFMALRIAVNRELESLNEGLKAAIRVTSEGGRVVVISYHSLEDRLVKGHFRELSRCKESEIPGTEQVYPQKIVSVLTKKPLTPTQEEVRANPRARSAKLRAVQVEILRR